MAIVEYQFSHNNWYHRILILLQQLVSELKVDEGRYVKNRKFYDKVRGLEVQWQRKFQLMAKEGEDIASAIGSS